MFKRQSYDRVLKIPLVSAVLTSAGGLYVGTKYICICVNVNSLCNEMVTWANTKNECGNNNPYQYTASFQYKMTSSTIMCFCAFRNDSRSPGFFRRKNQKFAVRVQAGHIEKKRYEGTAPSQSEHWGRGCRFEFGKTKYIIGAVD